MKCIARFSNIFLLILLLASACTDPTDIGADLLEGDEADVGFTDTLTVRATTLRADTVLSYAPARSYSDAYLSYLFGNMQDPIFGNSQARIYAQLALRGNVPKFDPTARLDSIVLVLPYNKSAVYGDATETYGIAVHRLLEYINPGPNVKYYTDQSFPAEGASLGTKIFVPNLDSVKIRDYVSGIKDSSYQVRVPAQLRIPLDAAFGEELIKLDTSIYKKDSSLVQYLKGIYLEPTTTNQGMLSFILPSTSIDPVVNSGAGIFLYYTEKDTVKKQMQLDFDYYWTRHTQIKHNYNNSLVERYIGNTQLGDSLVFVQGMAGVFTEIEIPSAEKLQGLVVNKAELELRIASPPNNKEDIFKPLPLLLVLAPNEKGEFEAVEDISLIINRLGVNKILEYYGGNPVDGKPGEPKVYRINLSTHFQRIVNKTRSNVLRIAAFNRVQEPGRVVLYGAKDPNYAIKLKVAFTRPPGG